MEDEKVTEKMETTETTSTENEKKNDVQERKSDVIECAIILGLSLITMIVGACIKNYNVARWLFTFSFVFAGYEILYSIIVKLCKKSLVIEEIAVLASALVLLYLGEGVTSCLVVSGYALVGFIEKIFLWLSLKRADYLFAASTYERDPEIKERLLSRAQNLKLLATEKPETKINFTVSLIFNVATIALGLLVAFIPPLFKISSYGSLLTGRWLPAGAIVVALAQISSYALAEFITYYSAIKGADEFGTRINTFKALDRLANVKRVVFDKTGVITDGTATVTKVVSSDVNKTLSLIAAAEQGVNGKILSAIKIYAKENDLQISDYEMNDVKYLSGKGIIAKVANDSYVIGSSKLLKENGVTVTAETTEDSVIYVAENGDIIGTVYVRYIDKTSFSGVMAELKEDLGLTTTLLSADGLSTVDYYKKKYGFDNAVSGAGVDYKTSNVKADNALYVGNGETDGEVLEKLDFAVCIGKSCGNGDVIDVEEDDERSVPRLLKLATRTQKKIKFCKIFSSVFKAAAIIGGVALSACGVGYLFVAPLICIVADAIIYAVAMTNSSEAV